MGFTDLGSLGSNTNKTAGQNVVMTSGEDVPVGDVIVVVSAADNTGTTEVETSSSPEIAITDESGNDYGDLLREYRMSSGAADDGAVIHVAVVEATTQLDTGDDISGAVNASRAAKSITAHHFGKDAGTELEIVGASFEGGLNTDVAALVLAGLPAGEYLLIYGYAAERNNPGVSYTDDADYTAVLGADNGTVGGSGDTNVSHRVRFRIATLTGDTADAATGNDGHVAFLIALRQVVPEPFREQLIAEIMADGPRALWGMQDFSGNPRDSSGNGLHMTSISGSADYREEGAIDDYSIRLIGGETMARSTEASTVTDNFTMILLVDLQALGGSDQLMFHNGNEATNGWGVRVESDGQFRGLAGGVAELALSGAVCLAKGHVLIHVIRRAGTWEYYCDGREQVANAGTTAPNAPSGTVVLGDVSIQTAYGLVAVIESAISAARVKAHYAAMGRAFLRDHDTNTSTGGIADDTFELDYPADIEEDDMLIAHFVSSDMGTITPPDATWRRVPRCAGHPGYRLTDSLAWAYYKRADGTESGSVTFSKSDGAGYYAGSIMSIGNVNWDFPFGYVRTEGRAGDVTTSGISTPYKGALGVMLAAYDTSVDTNESANVAFTGTGSGNWKKEIVADQQAASTLHYGIFVGVNYIDLASRDFDSSAKGAVAIDMGVGATEYSTLELCINSLVHAPSVIEEIWATVSFTATPTTAPGILTSEGTVEGIANRQRVLLPGMYFWGFVFVDQGETVTLSDWELADSGRDFVNVAASPFNNTDASDAIRLYVGYMTALTEADCWQAVGVGTDDDFVGTFDAARNFAYGVVAYSGPRVEDVVFPDGTFEETTSGSTAPDQTSMTIPEDGTIVILADACASFGTGVTVPTGYTERLESGNNFPKLTVADQADVPAGTEDPGTWTTGNGRHVLWKNFQSVPPEPGGFIPRVIQHIS